MRDYLEDITFSVCVLEKDKNPPWKKILTKCKKDLKESYKKAYAFGIYRELPQPPKEENPFFPSDKIIKNLRTTFH